MAFLGIMLGGDLYGQSSGSSNGIPVRTTMVGFAAYEVFEAGDLLIAMRTVRGVEILSDFGDLRRSFTDLAPGDPVEFFVSRGGVVLRVSFHLDERIEQGTPMSLRWDRAHDEARRAAAEYWEEQFAPLLPRSGSAVARGD